MLWGMWHNLVVNTYCLSRVLQFQSENQLGIIRPYDRKAYQASFNHLMIIRAPKAQMRQVCLFRYSLSEICASSLFVVLCLLYKHPIDVFTYGQLASVVVPLYRLLASQHFYVLHNLLLEHETWPRFNRFGCRFKHFIRRLFSQLSFLNAKIRSCILETTKCTTLYTAIG